MKKQGTDLLWPPKKLNSTPKFFLTPKKVESAPKFRENTPLTQVFHTFHLLL